MDNFATRPQDPYDMTDEQREFCRKEIFPYWAGKSVEDTFLARASEETKKIDVDTGFLDTDSKWRGGIGEISPDYVDQLFPKGFGGIIAENPLALNVGRFDQFMYPYYKADHHERID